MEVWASPLAADPANLRPVLVDTLSGDLLVFSQGSAAGGYGRYALREDKNSLRVWDLKAGTNIERFSATGLDNGLLLVATCRRSDDESRC